MEAGKTTYSYAGNDAKGTGQMMQMWLLLPPLLLSLPKVLSQPVLQKVSAWLLRENPLAGLRSALPGSQPASCCELRGPCFA